MPKYLKRNYKFIQFEKSNRKGKKYNAVLQNRKTAREVRVPFGAIKKDGTPHVQYKDSTGFGLYSAYDHGDKKRRDRYRARHHKEQASFRLYYSPGYFAWRFLW